MPTINSKFYIRQRVSPIFEKSLETIKHVLQNIYGDKNLTVVGELKEGINRELGRVTKDLADSPYCIAIPSNMDVDLDSYNSFALMKYGQRPVKMQDGYYYSFHVKPVVVTYSIFFYSQSLQDVLRWMTNWVFQARELTFNLDMGGFNVDVKIDVESAINFPTKEFEEGQPLKVESNLIVKTYVGDIYRTPEKELQKDKMFLVKNISIKNLDELFNRQADEFLVDISAPNE